MLKDVLKCAAGYMSDIFKLIPEERFASKVAESLYCLLVDAYIERFILAINQRFKLKMNIERVLLEFIYKDSLLKKNNKEKIVMKRDLVDFF